MPRDPSFVPGSLGDQQRRFAEALFDSGQTEEALPQFRGETGLTQRRLALYRGNLSAHWEQALADAYPVLKRQLGEEFFYHLGRAYGVAYPSRCGDLNRFGAALPQFLESFDPSAPYPWLPDLAQLEWALHRCHYAADAVPLAPAALMALEPEELDRLEVALHPAAILLSLDWDVSTLWDAHRTEPVGEWRASLGQPVTVLVWRDGWRPSQRIVSPGEAAALRALVGGAALGAALEAADSPAGGEDVGTLFAHWLADELLVRLSN